jgi:hypothetical protein
MQRILTSLSTLIILSFLLVVIPASAQVGPTIEQLDIALWPEFDRSAVLVIYRIDLAEDTPLPTQVTIPIPAEVGEPYAVAWQDADDQLIVATYQRQVSGDWATITLETESRFAQLEFYQDLNIDGIDRTFAFSWPGGYSAETLTYEIQRPAGSNGLVIDPPSTSSAPGLYGLNYHLADLGPLLPTSEFTITFSYTNSDDTLSVDTISDPAPLPTSPAFTPTGGTPDLAELVPWILGGAGGLLLLVAAFLFVRYQRERVIGAPSRRPRKRRRPTVEEKPDEIEASLFFCHNCGSKASASDFYCRRCGSQLRR